MGVMEKMRNSTASILWVLIFSFGILWVLADTQVFDALAVGPQSIGQVNGDEISFDEFNSRVSFYTEQYNQRVGGNMTPELRSTYEQQAWDDLVASKLVQQKMNELGIVVTDAELVDMITGDNPDPFIRQQFQNEDGTIDRIALRAAIEAPENSEVWLMIEQQLRENRRQQKMNNFISSGLKVSALDVQNEYIRQNSFADVSYLRFPYADVEDEEITITDNELQNYYRNNSSQYQRNESYRFRYVSWDKTPTAEDTLSTIREIENLTQAFADSESDSLFLVRYQSTTPYQGSYIDRDDIREEYSPVLDLEIGEVSDVEIIDGSAYAFKKLDERDDEIKFAVLSYNVQADPVATIDRLANEADDFQYYASSDGFVDEAERRDLEYNEASATKGNPLIPGLGQSQQTLQALEGLSVNEISEPIELNNQFIVLQLLERTPEGTRPFSEVRSQVENRVSNQKRKEFMISRVQGLASNESDLESLSSRSDKEILTAEDVRMSANTIPGAGREPMIIGAIFKLPEGEISSPLSGENAIFIVRVDNLDMATPDQMTASDRNEIRSRLEQQKFSAFNQIFIEQLKESADIDDYRSRVL